jgi:hypothetical protein
MFRRVKLLADEDATALGELDGDVGWDDDRWEDLLDDYFDEHDDIGTGPDAGPRAAHHHGGARRLEGSADL